MTALCCQKEILKYISRMFFQLCTETLKAFQVNYFHDVVAKGVAKAGFHLLEK